MIGPEPRLRLLPVPGRRLRGESRGSRLPGAARRPRGHEHRGEHRPRPDRLPRHRPVLRASRACRPTSSPARTPRTSPPTSPRSQASVATVAHRCRRRPAAVPVVAADRWWRRRCRRRQAGVRERGLRQLPHACRCRRLRDGGPEPRRGQAVAGARRRPRHERAGRHAALRGPAHAPRRSTPSPSTSPPSPGSNRSFRVDEAYPSSALPAERLR